MKKIRINVKKYLLHPPEVATNAVPCAFPGRFPTRIAWIVCRKASFEDYPSFEDYQGKPNIHAIRRFCKLRDSSLYDMWVFIEFDKKNVIFSVVSSPVLGRNALWLEGGHLWESYHPWDIPSPRITQFDGMLCLKRIGGLRLYAHQEKLKLASVDDYKRQMQRLGFLKTGDKSALSKKKSRLGY